MKHSETDRKIELCRNKTCKLHLAVLCFCVVIGLYGCGTARLTGESTPMRHETAGLNDETVLPGAGGENKLRQEKSDPASTGRLNADSIRYLGAFRLPDSEEWEWSGEALCFHSGGNHGNGSLFGTGHITGSLFQK